MKPRGTRALSLSALDMDGYSHSGKGWPRGSAQAPEEQGSPDGSLERGGSSDGSTLARATVPPHARELFPAYATARITRATLSVNSPISSSEMIKGGVSA